MLTDTELACIDSYLANETSINGNYYPNHIPAADFLSIWREQKSSTLLPLLGNQLILRKEIYYEKTIEQMRKEANGYPEILTFRSLLYNYTCSNPNDLEYFKIYYITCGDDFYTNTYTGKAETFVINGKTLKLLPGAKISKFLKKVSFLLGFEKEYEAFRIAHSQLLNEHKIAGTLCLSIHPLDYITMSDNDCDWDSCMAWEKRSGCGIGEYRRGTIEMLNSPYVLVAYLESATPMERYNLHWANKKWRELFIVHDACISGITGYPYNNKDLELAVLSWLRELAATNLGRNYESTPIKIDYDYKDSKRTITFDTDVMYNDFMSDNRYLLLNPEATGNFYINYSGLVICPICGKVDGDYTEPSQLICNSCEAIYTCESCGETITDLDDVFTTEDGEIICHDCYVYYYSHCDECNCEKRNSDLLTCYLALDHDNITYYKIIICEDCLKKLELQVYSCTDHNWRSIDYIIPTEEQLKNWGYSTELLAKPAHNLIF